jgi:hypothetical protein
MRSLLGLPFGKLPFYNWVADFDFNSSGQVSLPGEVVRRPLYADFFKIVDTNLMQELTSRLALQQSDYRQRLQRACNFFDMAMDQKDEAFRFSAYWIALEILVGSKNDAIKVALSRAYGHSNKTFADEQLYFKEIADARHDLIHKGLFRTLPSYHERLLQLYFWDIVIHKVGLQPRGLSRALVQCGLIEQEKNHIANTGKAAV